jgi:quercetin dioxygenase-like cupin family protein
MSNWIINPSVVSTVPFLDMRHVLNGDQLGRRITILEGTLPPGEFVPPHTHTREDEVAYVMSGSLTYWVDGISLVARQGSYVLKPRYLPHAFWNHTPDVASVMEIHVPGGQSSYYDQLGMLIGDPNMSDGQRQARIGEVQAEFGITTHPDLIPLLISDHGLQLQCQ